MARHLRIREPRHHWFLVGLLLATLVGVLLVQGYVQRSWNDVSGTPRTTAGSSERAPRGVLRDDRPVLDLSGDRPNTAAMPARTVALTFDDGPDPQWTPTDPGRAAAHHAHATFFVIGSRVTDYPDLVRRIVPRATSRRPHLHPRRPRRGCRPGGASWSSA